MSSIFKRKAFTAAHKQVLTTIRSLLTSVENAPNVVFRVNTVSLSVDTSLPEHANHDDIDTFVITTSAHPENPIIYTSTKNIVDLSVRDGGFF
jgi:hypothetical protein